MARRAKRSSNNGVSWWGRLFLVLFLLALAVIASAAYVLFSPVTPQNVESRLAGICRVGVFAVQIKASEAKGEKLKAGTCGCLATQITGKVTPAIAARMTESFRKLILYKLKRTLTFQGGREKSPLEIGLTQAATDEFAERFSEAAQSCNAAS